MKYIKELEGLRGIMALWVVAGHAFAAMPLLSHKIPANLLNTKAVDVFIMLSGFVIFFMLDNKRQSYSTYLTQRFFRIFPIYLVALFASLFTLDFSMYVLTHSPEAPATLSRISFINYYYNSPVMNLASHIFLLQGIVPGKMLEGSSFTILGQAWSVSVEWQFYLIAPFIFAMLNGLYRTRNFLIVIFLLSVFFVCGKFLDKGFLGHNLLAFSVGYLTFYFYKNIAHKLNKTQLHITVSVFILMSIVAMKKDCIPFVIWGVCFYFVLIKENFGSESFICNMLNSLLVSHLGKISYSVYMVHMLVVYIMMYFMLAGASTVPLYMYILFPVACIAVSVFISSLTYQYVEKPMIRFGKKLTAKTSTETSRAG
ncbi:acyltransferase family protein [Klebsiella oxytoca]